MTIPDNLPDLADITFYTEIETPPSFSTSPRLTTSPRLSTSSRSLSPSTLSVVQYPEIHTELAEALLMAQRYPPQAPEEIKAINLTHKKGRQYRLMPYGTLKHFSSVLQSRHL